MPEYTTPPAKQPARVCPGAPRPRFMSPILGLVERRTQSRARSILRYNDWPTQSRRNDRVRENVQQLRTELRNVLKDLWELDENDRDDRHTTDELVDEFFRTDESYEHSDEDLNTPPCTPKKQIRRCTE